MPYDEAEYLSNGTLFVRRFVVDRSPEEIAALERQYAPKLAEVPHAELPAWVNGGDVDWMEIEPKADALRIHGTASTPAIDSHRQAIWSRGIEARLPLPLFSEHAKDYEPIGSIYFIRRSVTGVYIRAWLDDHFAAQHAEKLIKSGDVACFSVSCTPGSGKVLSVVDGVKFYDGMELREVSVCRAGANPNCRFEILRDGDDGRKFWDAPLASKAEAPSLPLYKGVWKADQWFRAGEFATFKGGLWAAQIDSQGLRPNESPAGWKLCVKSGEAHKLEAK
ncbi:hypothetical protein [Mesorhizobium sp. LjNodule214]|uniref:hypothetical protein n=1 Tax=Mesorhizobium sp. LjNodule214 TaxID=3342252 RepID=UPI003ECE03A3